MLVQWWSNAVNDGPASIQHWVDGSCLLAPWITLVRHKCVSKRKVKVHVYSPISSLKTYHPTLHLTPWSLALFIRVPFQLHGEHTVLQPFRRIKLIVHIAISVLPGIHFHLSQVKHLRVKCLAQGHNISTMSQDWEGRNIIFLWTSCTKRDSKPHGRQRHRQSATL